MARSQTHIRVLDSPNGKLQLVPKGSGAGREITGLSYNAGNRTYYSLLCSEGTRARRYWGRDLDEAVKLFLASQAGPPPLSQSACCSRWNRRGCGCRSRRGRTCRPSTRVQLRSTRIGLRSTRTTTPSPSSRRCGKRSFTPEERERLGIADPQASTHTLRDCPKVWQAVYADRHPDHLSQVKAVGGRFIKRVGSCIAVGIRQEKSHAQG